jgi:hypothetical protein
MALLETTTVASASPRSSARAERAAYDLKRTHDWLMDKIAAGRKSRLVDIITLTPPLAEVLISEEHNPINRPISSGNEGSILSDIANGRFEFNGESIVISNTGKLLDGQHRCHSVIKSGIPIETVIVFGVRDEARFTIDLGKPKLASHFLAMQGHKYTAMLAAATRLVLMYRATGSILSGGNNHNKVTKTEIVNAVGQLRGLTDSVELTCDAPKSLGAKSVLAFAHYVISKRASREAADFFFKKMIEGADLRRGDPILYCSRRLGDLRSGTNGGVNARAELIFKCWNAHRLGETDMTKLPLNGRLPKVER